MELSDIKREKDLRKITFADLFYEIYDEPNGEEIALGIIRSIMPNFDESYCEGRIEAAKYQLFRNDLVAARLKRDQYSQVSSQLIPGASTLVRGDFLAAMMFRDLWETDKVMEIHGGSIEKSFNEGSFESICSELYKEYAEASNPTEGDKKHRVLINAFVKDDARYEEFLANLDKKITDLATGALGSSKVIKGLFLLPRLESDQELIIFFGNNFHVTFNSIDAYTGLLYASEFFDYDGEILSSLANRFDASEINDAKQAESDRIAAQREEEARREEERKRSEKYNNAVKAYENGNYESAFKDFDELGEYRDAKTKAQEAKVKRDEKARIDNMRSEASTEASRIMQPISIKEKYGSKEHRVSWKILDVVGESGRVLMTTTDCIGDRPWGHGTWSACSLREWLNDEFYSSLPEDVRVRIAATEVQDLDAGTTVEDKIFILSVDEVHKYFKDHWTRKCKNPGEKNTTRWWMRNLSTNSQKRGVRVVDKDGEAGNLVTVTDTRRWRQYGKWEDPPAMEGGSSTTAVRPALWVQTGIDESSLAKRREDEGRVTAYKSAKDAMYDGEYEKARNGFRKLGDYRDSKSLAELCDKGIYFAKANKLMAEARTEKDYLAAIAMFEKADDFHLSKEDGYSSLSARTSKANCEMLAKKVRLTESLAELAACKPKEENGPVPLDCEVELQITEKKNLERKLSNLGLFHGSEKQKLRAQISELESKIATTRTRASEQKRTRDAKYKDDARTFEAKAKPFLASISVGDELFFGGAKRTGYNGKPNPWAWKVVAKSGGELIMWAYGGSMAYHNTMEETDWRHCSLRKSLMKIYQSDFTSREKGLIKKVKHGDASDFLFIPNNKEFEQYGISHQVSGGVWARSDVDDRGEAEMAGTWYSRTKCTEERHCEVLVTLKLY